MKTFNKKSMIINHWIFLVSLETGITFGIIQISFFSTILHDINQILFIIPGAIFWMIAVYLLIIGTFAEYWKKPQAPTPVFVNLRSNSPNKLGPTDNVYQKSHKSLLDKTGWRYGTSGSKFVSKSKNC